MRRRKISLIIVASQREKQIVDHYVCKGYRCRVHF